MSKTKVKQYSIILLLLFFAIFLFACKTHTPVADIHFVDESIVLLIGDTYSPNVSITPTYSSNKKYTITSENPSIVSVRDNILTAVKEGDAVIRVVSEDNSMLEDVMTVSVKKSVTILDTPRVSYNSNNQTINFDMIANASSYTLKINGIDVDMGNSTSYSLTEFNKISKAYDDVLTIQVRANSPSYSHAFQNSTFSTGLKIYQAESVQDVAVQGGALSFKKPISTEYSIQIDGTEILKTTQNNVNLTNLDINKSGYCELSVTSLVADDKKVDASVTYYNSLPIKINVKVASNVDVKMIESLISWQNNADYESYNIYIDGVLKANTTNNYFDLITLSEYNELINTATPYKLTVEPILKSNVINVVKFKGASSIVQFNRLKTPTVVASNNLITWNAVEGASSYEIYLTYGTNEFKFITEGTSFSLNNYPSNTSYNIEVRAISTTGENNLSSFAENVEIVKQAQAELSIDDYSLNFATADSERYLIEFNTKDEEFSRLVVAGDESYNLDLSSFNFNEGLNTIYVTHIGDGESIFDSAKASVSFTQLADEDSIQISNGVLSVDKSEINQNATYTFKITGADTEFSVESLSYLFNTTEESAENYLASGDYSVSLYITGDGKTTFSLKNNGKASANANFTVLNIPSLSLQDKSSAVLTISGEDRATKYNIYTIDDGYEIYANVSENLCDFDIANEPIRFVVQAIGDGTNTLNSKISSDIVVQKLVTPTLTYHAETDIVSLLDVNDTNLVFGYVLKVNGEASTYNFDVAYANFVVGDNLFEVYLEAIDANLNRYYINSDAFSLNINKIDCTSDLELNEKGQLIITPTNQVIEHNLALSITINNEESLYVSNGNELVNETYTLNYKYENGQYIIDLLSEDYSPIINEMTSNFSIKFKFIPKDATSTVSSSYSESKEVMIELASNVGRREQYLTISLLDPTHNYQNYSLLINQNSILKLDEACVVDSELSVILVDIDYVYSNLESNYGEFEVAVITNNVNSTATSLRLSKKGESKFVSRANSLSLTKTKDNSAENNSVVISFNIDEENYEKTYILSIYNLEDGEKTNIINKVYSNTDAVDKIISYNLDEVQLTGTIYASLITITTGTKNIADKGVLMFNSLESEPVVVEKIDAVSNIYVSNGVLHFDATQNAIGYEIYKITGAGAEKINTGLVQNTTYDLTNLSSEATIAIKAISSVNYTNSNLSDTIKVNKLATPIISISNGELSLSLSENEINLLKDEIVDIKIQVNNGVDTLHLDLSHDGVTNVDNSIQIISDVILNFGTNAPLLEHLTFKIVVNYTSNDTGEDVYYINSNISEVDVYGLLKAKDLRKFTTKNEADEIVESISFVANDSNVIDGESLIYGYTFKIITNEQTYSSTDSKLMYRNCTINSTGDLEYSFASYPILLLDTNFVFPYGYDENGDGTIDENEIFKAGDYSLSVKTIAKNIQGLQLLNSRYSDEITFTISAIPEINVINGRLEWSNIADCTYLVRVYDNANNYESVAEIDTVSINSFEFLNSIFDSYYGLYAVSVQAISSNSLVINSAESEKIIVYRMPKITDVMVDDGYLVITANNFFNFAEITFTDTITNRSEKVTYSRAESADEKLTELAIDSWQDFDLTNVSDLYDTSNFIIVNLDSAILNIMANRNCIVDIKLFGNSNNYLAIISSAISKNASELNVTKLSNDVTEVEKGVFTFDCIEEYKSLNINYNFNNKVITEENTIWNNARVYKITLKVNETTHEIYAFDYNSFIQGINSGLIVESDYEIVENLQNLYAYYKYSYDGTNYLYFNVFENNSINLKDCDSINYYKIENVLTDFETKFTGYSDVTTIDLSVGGSFVVSVALLGGDSILDENLGIISHTAYLNANVTNLKTFVRYSTNYLSTQDGKILLQNMQITIDEQVIDYPIYKLRVNLLNNTDITNVYLYHSDVMTKEQAKLITKDETGIYSEIVFSDTLAILFDFANYFEAGSYQIDVQTLAGLSTITDSNEADYLLDARVPSSKYGMRKITSTQFASNSGTLEFDLAYVLGVASEKIYIYDYEITIEDLTLDKEYVYSLSRTSEGVSISNNKVSYTLPKTIQVLGEDVTLPNSHDYTIKIKALALDEQNLINASYPKTDGVDNVMTFVRSSGVSEQAGETAQIANGVLRWKVLDLTNYTLTKVDLLFLDANNEIQHIMFNTTGTRVNDEQGNYLYHTYTFTDGLYTITSTGAQTYINPSIEYTVSVCVVGTTGSNNVIVNSTYSDGFKTSRLSSVENLSIISLDGELTWQEVSGAIKYVVYLSGSESFTFEVETNSIDFNSITDINGELITAGNYSVSIRAIGDENINSKQVISGTTFIKLAEVTGIAIDSLDRNYITWNPVENADGYLATFKYGDSQTVTTLIEGVDNVRVAVPNDVSGYYILEVSAQGIGIGNVFNSTVDDEKGTFESSVSRPEAVNAIEYDEENQRYYWTTSSDFLSSDNLRISYNLYEYVANIEAPEGSILSDTISKSPTITISASDSNSYYEEGDTRYYFFKPTIVGYYSDFVVQVERANSIYSSTTRGENIDFNLYSYGQGTTENPYRLKTSTHLMNITYNKNANYELIGSISIEDVDISTRLNKYGAIISDVFGGVIDGNDFVIYGLDNVQLEEMNNFALFNTINSAVIKNLTVGLSDNNSNISNSFANSYSNVINLSVIAVNATTATIQEVNVHNFYFTLCGAGSLSGNVYASGLVTNLTNSSIIDCNVNVNFNFDIAFTSRVSVGGMVSQSISSSIYSTSGNFNTSLTLAQAYASNTFDYVGGVVANFVGENERTSTISSAIANVNFTNVNANYMGGIVGLIRLAKISGCKSTGIITNQSINKNASIGGVAGIIQSAIAENTGTNIEFNLKVTNTSLTAIYIGAFAGNIGVVQSVATTIDNCYANIELISQTNISSGVVTLGIYGYKTQNNVTINNWYTMG